MFREFNIKFEDVEMVGGTDNLLEGTEVTKVIMRGDNKMSSLDSTFKNCAELDTIDGEIDLNGVTDIDNMLQDTELVKSINLKNINNENISANNSFSHIEEMNIGGDLYNKKAMQNVIASKDWTFDNINYVGVVGDNVITKEINVVNDNKTTIEDALEQKVRSLEIVGQTYENLVVGSGEVTLIDELALESIDGNPKEFNPHIEQEVCVEVIEGQTYQNLIEGKGEYNLTDTYSATWTESNNSIDNPPSMIEMSEIWGNTVQDETDLSYIQSVGDLYVDEENNPILDDEGNEQYKLELVSSDGSGKSNKTTILLPQPLRSVANGVIKDKLYWDYNENKYFIERYVGKQVINLNNITTSFGQFVTGSQYTNMIKLNGDSTGLIKYDIRDGNLYDGICDKAPCYSDYVLNWQKEGEICCSYNISTRVEVDGVTNLLSWRVSKEYDTYEKALDYLKSLGDITFYVRVVPEIIKTKILEKPSLETYSPKTYVSTNTEVQPSQMTITNKRNLFTPLGLQADKDYTLQLDSVGKDDKNITVNLGGTETTIQPVNDTKKHHKVVVRTPATLINETLELSGEGVTVNDVMLFQGGSNDIKQEVGYIDGIESIGELQGDGTYKIDILSNNGEGKTLITEETLRNAKVFGSGGSTYFDLGIKPIGKVKVKASFDKYFTVIIENFDDSLQITNRVINMYNVAMDSSEKEGDSDGNSLCIGFRFTGDDYFIANGQGKDSVIELFKTGRLSLVLECEDESIKHTYEKQSTQSILLPQPLNKIGDIKDRFYWDEDKGHYCIEQNVGKYVVDDSVVWIKTQMTSNAGYIRYWHNSGFKFNSKIEPSDSTYVSSKYKVTNGGGWTTITENQIQPVKGKAEFYTSLLANTVEEAKQLMLGVELYYPLEETNIIDLPHLNKKCFLDTYMSTTYLQCVDTAIQPSKLLLESDIVRYKPSALETNTDYTVQFECLEKSDKKLKLNLGGVEKEITPIVGVNHVSITTPSEIDVDTYKDRLFLSGVGNKVDNVMLVKGEMQQYPEYFDGVQSVGQLQEDGTYKVDILSHGESSYMAKTGDYEDIGLNKYKRIKRFNVWDNATPFYLPKGTYSININSSSDIMWQIGYYNSDGSLKGTSNYNTSSQGTFTSTSDYIYILTCKNVGDEVELLIYDQDGALVNLYESHKTSISTNEPLRKAGDVADKLYWNKDNKRYEIDRNGEIEVPIVEGDIIGLPKLYQREDTNIIIESGNIKPSNMKVEYKEFK